MDILLQQKLTETTQLLNGEKIERVQSLGGSYSQQRWQLNLQNGRQLFAKTTQPEDFRRLEYEAEGLKELRRYTDTDLLIIPEPLAIEKNEDFAILIMPWLDLGNGTQRCFGRGLAKLHNQSNKQNPGYFGWEKDGYIGAGTQPKGWGKGWGKCFVELRLIPQFKIAKKWGLEVDTLEILCSKIANFLEKHKPLPCLVHGDLWSGNYGIQKNGKGILIDPAIWWADREVDIAMSKLFGGFSEDFYKGYEEIWPLPKSSSQRIDIYNLYHLLNHANIFGGGYKNQCCSTLNKITKNLKSYMDF